jgi:uncharacterized YccA/Bax inhibitor family protein
MALLKSSNPALSGDAFRVGAAVFGDSMTISGTVNKTGILLICVVATAAWSWNLFTRSPQTALPLLAVGGIGGFIVALVTIFKKAWSPVTAPMYALLEGLVLGSASAMLEMRFPGIAMQAVGLTFGTLVALLLAYRSGIIRATAKFKIGIVAATGGIAVFYLIQFVLGFFGVHFAAINEEKTRNGILSTLTARGESFSLSARVLGPGGVGLLKVDFSGDNSCHAENYSPSRSGSFSMPPRAMLKRVHDRTQ